MMEATLPMVDPAAFDARAILRTIATDERQPGAVRVQACKALMAGEKPPEPSHNDLINKRAIEIMRRVH
jgi:hypothetical protein